MHFGESASNPIRNSEVRRRSHISNMEGENSHKSPNPFHEIDIIQGEERQAQVPPEAVDWAALLNSPSGSFSLPALAADPVATLPAGGSS